LRLVQRGLQDQSLGERMSQIEIFRGQARRRWSVEAKRRLVAETLVPGATVHAVAQRHGVNTSQLFTWRKRFRTELGLPPSKPPVPAFAAVELAPAQDFSEAAEQQPVAEADARPCVQKLAALLMMPPIVLQDAFLHGQGHALSSHSLPAAVRCPT
jgi:transposase-like protein